MFLLREFLKSFIISRKKRIGFVLSVWPTPYYGRIMASTRLRAYDVINNFQSSDEYFVELYKPWKHYDIVIFQKKFDEQALQLAKKLKKQGVKIILDINVNYYDKTILGVLNQDESANHPKILRFTETADGVITSTDYIQDYAKRFFPEKPIVCIPENISDTFFSVKKMALANRPLKLLYVGYAVKAPEILDIQEVLQKLRQKHDFSLLLICEKNPRLSIPGIDVAYRPYQQKHIHEQMLDGDIFIAPRDLTQSYNLGHSFTKIGYPMSIGLPVIASEVPSYVGSPAILCKNKADWYNNLDFLLGEAAKRAALGIGGVAYCREHFSASVTKERYARFFQKLLRR